jgi:hypothetical protein
MQWKILWAFFVLIMGYQVLHTFLWWWRGVREPEHISVAKDVLWMMIVVWLMLFSWNATKQFVYKNKILLLVLTCLLIRSFALSRSEQMSIGSIVVWAKYDLYPLIVLVSAIALWSILPRASRKPASFLHILLWLLSGWLLWQLGKIVFPDFFVRWWYGPVGDYVLWSAPPIWYRTWPGGMMRLQWLFSWPNNYGFFLAWIAPLVTYLVLTVQGRKKRFLGALYVFCLARTISRGAWIGAWVWSALLIWFHFPAYKKYVVWWWVLVSVAIIALSFIKSWSTSGHRIALQEWLIALRQQPRGYGLGMAWPSVHYEWVYLPENQYMQIVLDLGIPWFLLWCGVWWMVMKNAWKNIASVGNSMILLVLFCGICWLLVEGMVLHVREDSMVNYLILGFFGFIVWQKTS